MSKTLSLALLAGASLLSFGFDQAAAFDGRQRTLIYADQPQQAPPEGPNYYAERSGNRGGGFIEFLFGGMQQGQRPPIYQQQPSYEPQRYPMQPQPYGYPRQQTIDPTQRPFDPVYEKQLVEYDGNERPGTIVIDTPNKFLFLVLGDGRALRYGIGVGRPGFTWSGVKTISAKKEWPEWTPPAQMLARRPDLPRHMEGGPENPLGARAMYLGS
jgi:lipoprotein-anchoring transpeptidase ErfK/SrfK